MQNHMPKMVESYHHFTAECFREGALSASEKQLIALGISLINNNEVCTYYHVEEALQHGATQEQVLEAAAVAAALGGGHAMSQGVTRVQEALHQAGKTVQ
ncbi:carboxymuconolactone decarboxylase family protein [Marinicrinis sediminis]|uniref:Carboxymuconolactone decarboxylase family protein n=1 Tax=Marinicrinis sediminis TaxID=1652465 RepID=A0ABW5RF06_9BACL